jgi:LytTr DNA-binding domain
VRRDETGDEAPHGTPPGRRAVSRRLRQAATIAVVALVVVLVDTSSVEVDLARRHVPVLGWEPAVWGLTSWLALVLAIPVVLAADAVRARSNWAYGKAAALLTLGALFFAVHIAAMIGLRTAIYGLSGHVYDFGPLPQGFAYEGRKDALTFAVMLGGMWLWARAFPAVQTSAAPAATAAPGDAEPAFIADSRNGRVVIRAPEIDWVEAQGNYVALHAGGQSYLIRQPLKAVGDKLRPAAFVRTHRSALVNTRRVRAIRRSPAGGLRVELVNAEFAPLSDRHKAAVVKALAAAG